MKKINLSFKNINSDFLDYCPFRLGLAPSEIGLRKIDETSNELIDKVFQIDPVTLELYLESKKQMRAIHPNIEYINHLKNENDLLKVFNFMATQLSKEYPKRFEFDGKQFKNLETGEGAYYNKASVIKDAFPYKDGLDFIAFQIQEDFCLVHKDTLKNDLIHLCSPNDWTASWGIDKDFDEIHVRVPRAKEIVKKPSTLFQRLSKGTHKFDRLGAMTLTSYPYLLRHPSHKETPIKKESPYFYFRFERQTLSAVADTPYLLFTIRPYLMDFTQKLKEHLFHDDWNNIVLAQKEYRYSWFFKDNFEYFNSQSREET